MGRVDESSGDEGGERVFRPKAVASRPVVEVAGVITMPVVPEEAFDIRQLLARRRTKSVDNRGLAVHIFPSRFNERGVLGGRVQRPRSLPCNRLTTVVLFEA